MSATVLLVHGAFADGSSWNKVIAHLREAGITARAVPNQLRGLTVDGEYVAGVVAQTEGDVVLVGHSYGGPVITYAGSTAGNVKGLVFVAAFGLDKGQSAQEATGGYPASELASALQPWSYPGSDLPEFTIQVDKYRSVFAADVTEEEAAAGAANQRPAAALALGEPLSAEPAWKRLPCWWVVSGADRSIDPEYQRATAEAIGATVTELEGGSHSIAVSRSREVADVIVEAVRSVS
ncbi:pimeloyl-ACP methyl ester carboxylesterase [Streptomyces aurantiacus]|uniref:alpha/beta fold hydrolase n=1 Tax=Streptomyces aurantiacus TaxID=47760 RepID=UPI00278CC6E8|nr:alpha/beta hydrolase [Streptomyces aurantiacus]MDQ0771754.1 pimeloyl-ACP methyl ester carboxylesterase [Streptomyces aurantiacus]